MSKDNSKQEKSNSSETTKKATAQAVSASQPTGTTSALQASKDIKQKRGLAEAGKSYNNPGPLKLVEIDNCPEITGSLKYRFPRGREARIDAVNTVWRQLLWEHLPISSNNWDVIVALGARWVELATMVDREAPTPEEKQRVRAFLREFLILACAPESAPAAAESEAA